MDGRSRASNPPLDRFHVKMKPLAERHNRVLIERDHVPVSAEPSALTGAARAVAVETATRIAGARRNGRPVMLTFGAHTIKNGLSPVLIWLIEQGWVTHLATNGAGIIHDWEFAFQGASSEDVQSGVERGEFGNWHETGFYINLAITVGASEGRGYGDSVGALIEREGLEIPTCESLSTRACELLASNADSAAACLDLLASVRDLNLDPGWLQVPHPFKEWSLQAAAFRLGVPFTGHPMIGHDIIYNHPANNGGAIGRAAVRDFLTFAGSISRLDQGVYLSIGSAVMSPMVFEKSLSMAKNIALQEGRRLAGYFIAVVDLAESHWDWSAGEPPEDNPDYYIRYCKSFTRMGGELRYASADNRDFLLELAHTLQTL